MKRLTLFVLFFALLLAACAPVSPLPSGEGQGEGIPSPTGGEGQGEGIHSPTGRVDEGEGLPSPSGRGAGGEGLPSPAGSPPGVLREGAGGEGLPLGRWLFSPSILAWGNDILASCLPADLFIVDELGPLELMRGEGWVNAIEALRSGRYNIGLVVIRPELVEKAQQQLPINEVISLAK